MSIQENRIIATLISTFVVFGYYLIDVYDKYISGYFLGNDATERLGKGILYYIGSIIVVTIIAQIVVTLVNPGSWKDCKHDISDERDKLIELKGMKVSFTVFGIGFLFTIISLTYGLSIIIVFNLVLLCLVVGDIIGNIVKLYYYRRGF